MPTTRPICSASGASSVVSSQRSPQFRGDVLFSTRDAKEDGRWLSLGILGSGRHLATLYIPCKSRANDRAKELSQDDLVFMQASICLWCILRSLRSCNATDAANFILPPRRAAIRPLRMLRVQLTILPSMLQGIAVFLYTRPVISVCFASVNALVCLVLSSCVPSCRYPA